MPKASTRSTTKVRGDTPLLFTLAASVFVIAGLFWGRALFAPLLVAGALVVIAYPVRGAVRRGAGSGFLATAALVAVCYSIVIAMAALLFFAATRFAQLLPEYSDDLENAPRGLADLLTVAGLDRASSDDASGWLQPGALLTAAGAIVDYVMSSLTTLCLILVFVFFLSVDSTHFRSIRSRFFESRRRELEALTVLAADVRRYFAVNAVFGALVAALDVLLLLILQVPGAAVWGVLAFVTNFIPNIGFVLGLIPAVGFALLSGGWVAAILVGVGYCVINVVLQVFIQPRFVGEAVHLSQTLAFGSVLFWSAVIGPLGAILAVPLTVATRAGLLHRSTTGWPWWLTGDRRDHEGDAQ